MGRIIIVHDPNAQSPGYRGPGRPSYTSGGSGGRQDYGGRGNYAGGSGGGGGGSTADSRIVIDRTSPDDYQKILKPKKTDKRMEFHPNIPKTLTPKGYAKLKLMMSVASSQYKMMVNKLTRQGRLWEDEDFPATDASIGNRELAGQVEWKRPKELNPNAEFFVDGASRFDIEQGELGDCWLLAVLSSISSYPCLYDHVLPKEQRINDPKYCGIFRARFWRFGQWIEVLVDDRLPVRRGTNQLMFMHSTDSSEFWSALAEKAYAKLNGCYKHLDGGSQSEAMVDLTGGVCETFTLSQDKREPNFEKEMMRFMKHCCLMGCSVPSEIIEERLTGGLIAGHAYSVTGISVVGYRGKQQVLVRCRNPWGGSYEWTGPWSDNSSEWSYVSQQDKQKLHLTFRSDGEFWMSYEDFVSRFTTLEVCHLGLDSLEDGDNIQGKFRLDEAIHTGKWELKISAGGCVNNRATFWTNPQFRVTLTDPDPEDDDNLCSAYIGLMQKDMRKKGKEYIIMGFMVYEVDPNQTTLMSRANLMVKQPVAKTAFTNAREVTGHFRLKPGSYVIIPSTFEPAIEGHFILRVLTTIKVEDCELDNNNVEIGLNDNVQEAVQLEDDMLSEDEDIAEKFRQLQDPATRSINAMGLRKLLNESSLQDVEGFTGFSTELCRSLVASVDFNQTGTCELSEFMDLWRKAKTWKTVFLIHDADRSGYFDDTEFRIALEEMGYKISNKMFNCMVHRYQDPDTSQVRFEDFILCAIRMRNAFDTVEAHPKNTKGTILFNKEDYLRFAVNI